MILGISRSAAAHFVCRDGAPQQELARRRFSRTRLSKVFRRSSAWMARTRREQRSHSDQSEAAGGARRSARSEVIRRLQPKLAKVEGITLLHAAGAGSDGGRSRQPHAVSIQLGRRGSKELNDWAPQLVDKLQRCPQLARCRQRPADRRLAGDAGHRPRYRSRLGITPQMIDDALYDAFGQRQISTMFTQLNQYHVVLEVEPQFQRIRRIAQGHLCAVGERRARCRSSAFTHFEIGHSAACHQSSGTISGGDALVQSGARCFAGRRGQGDQQATKARSACRQHPGELSKARPQAFQTRLRTSRC